MSDMENPYAAPVSSHTQVDASGGQSIVVDGELVCVGSRAHLPSVCVISGRTDDLVQLQKTVTYAGPVVIFAFVLSPLIGLILYLIVRKKTELTFYMDREVHSRRRRKTFYGVLSFIAAGIVLFGLIASGAMDRTLAPLIIPLGLLVISLILMVLGTALLSVKTFRKPGTFWLKGFKGPFFSALADGSYNVTFAGF